MAIEPPPHRAAIVGCRQIRGCRHIDAVVKVLEMVNAEPDFADHPKVMNGCSDLLDETLGDAGRHARSAVGMGSLPNGVTIEIEAILLIRSCPTRFLTKTARTFSFVSGQRHLHVRPSRRRMG
jgi:hypothetical protein